MAASNIRTESVSFASNGDTANGYLARPAGDGPFPAIVVIQEWWGLDAHIKDLAERFAGEGFVALAPDFYHGQVTTEPDDARKLVMALNGPIALRETGGAIVYLSNLPDVEPKSVGVIGFCAGGRLALAAAATGDERIGAVAACSRRRSSSEASRRRCSLSMAKTMPVSRRSSTTAWRRRWTGRKRPSLWSSTPARATPS